MPFVDISMDDYDDEELIDELRDRGYYVGNHTDEYLPTLNEIFHLRREGKPYDHILEKFLTDKLGRVI
jgi:hypothetical protein